MGSPWPFPPTLSYLFYRTYCLVPVVSYLLSRTCCFVPTASFLWRQVDCITVSLFPFKASIEDQLQRVTDVLTLSLRNSVLSNFKTIDTFLEDSMDKLGRRPRTISDISEVSHVLDSSCLDVQCCKTGDKDITKGIACVVCGTTAVRSQGADRGGV